jgi:hypothetical protein
MKLSTSWFTTFIEITWSQKQRPSCECAPVNIIMNLWIPLRAENIMRKRMIHKMLRKESSWI